MKLIIFSLTMVPFIVALLISLLFRHSRMIPRAMATIQNINLPGGSGTPSVGTILSLFNTSSPGVYNPIGNFSGGTFAMKAVTADTTNMGTAWKQHIVTLMDAGTVDGELHFVPASPGQVHTVGLVGHSFTAPGAIGYVFVNQTTMGPQQYSLAFPDGSTVFFSATIDDFPIAFAPEKDLMVKLKFGVTGQPTYVGF